MKHLIILLLTMTMSTPLTAQAFDITLAWLAPTRNVDGTVLLDLWGYGLCAYDTPIPDDRDLLTCNVLFGLETMVTVTTEHEITFYRVFALDYNGNSSALSNEAIADYQMPPLDDHIPPAQPPSKPNKPGLRVTDISP